MEGARLVTLAEYVGYVRPLNAEQPPVAPTGGCS
jgi:hypothetical protein